MKLGKLYKYVNINCDVEIVDEDNSTLYTGVMEFMPINLAHRKVVEIDPLGDDGYNRLLISVENKWVNMNDGRRIVQSNR